MIFPSKSFVTIIAAPLCFHIETKLRITPATKRRYKTRTTRKKPQSVLCGGDEPEISELEPGGGKKVPGQERVCRAKHR